MKRKLMTTVAAASALAAAATTGWLYHARAVASDVPQAASALPSAPPEAAPRAVAVAGAPDFTAIVQRYGPAVVNVSTTGTAKAAVAGPPPGALDPRDPFHDFFRRFQPPPGAERLLRGLGSGFIVDSNGVILTNAHVVDGASEVTVKLTDRREFPAKVVGVDKSTDVAVLRIEAKNLPSVQIGDPSRTRVGEWVLAIGAPFGFENSATAGIVSARSRSLPGEGYVPFLQTDVAVNPGNSGGPLFNAAGQVIGINSQIYSQSGGYMGLSFAIPIDVAMRVEGQLVAHGKVTRGRLGVTIQDVDQALASAFGLDHPEGALVSSVEAGGPADAAGLRPGDIILGVDGNAVSSSGDLPPRVADLRPGARTRLQVWRDHRKQDVDVKVGGADDATVAGAPARSRPEHGRLGLAVRALSPEERQQVGGGGVLVEEAAGLAARAGIQPGDVILAVNDSPVKTVEQLQALVGAAHDRVALLVERGEAKLFVPVQLG